MRPVRARPGTVHARLVTAVIEDDHDVHLVIAQPYRRRHTMIVESPDVTRNGARRSAKRTTKVWARPTSSPPAAPSGPPSP